MSNIFEKFVQLYNAGFQAGFSLGVQLCAIALLTIFVVRGTIWLYRKRK